MLRRIDPYTAATLGTVPITIPTGTVIGGNGLAVNPQTNELWAILQLQGQGGNRALAKINPPNGAATVSGMTGMSFASIAFDVGGRLYGVTGDGAATPETLYTIDLVTAQPTLFVTLGNGSDGEAICWHRPSNQLFHASGLGLANVDEILETVDVNTRTTTNVPISGGDWDEVLAMSWFAGDNLLVCDLNSDLWTATTTGRINRIGQFDHNVKGIARVIGPGANGAYFELYGSGCRAPNGLIAMMGGSGSPTPTLNVSFQVLNGPPGAAGVLALGTGNSSFALSPNCILQTIPLSPIVISFALSPAGVFTVPFLVPPLPPLDVYLQAAVISGGQLTVSNSIKMHVQ